MQTNTNILLAFYGDDFTGSTDALEFLSKSGVKTVLFLENPPQHHLDQFEGLQAIGIAGLTRAMTPDKMKATLEDSFLVLKSFTPQHIHYKVCSTFDSSPDIGNIGTAIEVGQNIFKNTFTPILIAAPNLGRYSAFGNLFAEMGIGSKGNIFRLDRHPSMSHHPTTPSLESDLRLHLALQSEKKMGLIDLIDLSQSLNHIVSKIQKQLDEGAEIIFFDAMYPNHMTYLGEILETVKPKNTPLFSVGSSGIENALGDYWIAQQQIKPKTTWEILSPALPILVLSGSVSPVTAGQIEFATQHGFKEIPISIEALKSEVVENKYVSKYKDEILQHFKNGKSVILHTSKGPQDPRIEASKAHFASLELNPETMRSKTAQTFGKLLGKIARNVLKDFSVQRLVIAGGDTSSFVARELGILAVEMIAPLYTGAPVCRAYAPESPADGIEVNLKGGQVGDPAYFISLQNGQAYKNE